MVGPRVDTMYEEAPALHHSNVGMSEKYRVFSHISNEVSIYMVNIYGQYIWSIYMVNIYGQYL